jgi:hypothetical protein
VVRNGRGHLERAHLRIETARCRKPECPPRPWKSCFKGKGDREKKRLANECPHNHLEDRAYVWKEDLDRIFKEAERLEREARWQYLYRNLFDLVDNDRIPDPCEWLPYSTGDAPRCAVHFSTDGEIICLVFRPEPATTDESRDSRVLKEFTARFARLDLRDASDIPLMARSTLEEVQRAIPE